MTSTALIVGVSVAAGIGVLVVGLVLAFCVYMHKSRSDSSHTPVKRMKARTKSIRDKADKLKASTYRTPFYCSCCHVTKPHCILLPDPPQHISLISGPHSVTVSWREPDVTTGSEAIVHFKVYKRVSKALVEWRKVGKVKPGVSQFLVKSLVPETSHVFGVASVNRGGTSAIVESDSIAVKGTDVIPDPPTHLRIEEKFKNTITLTWRPPKRRPAEARISTYHLAIHDGAWRDLATLTALDRFMRHKIVDLELHTPYRFRVAAESEDGWRGPDTETETVILSGEPDVPGKPAGPLKYSHVTHHSVSLSWRPASHPGSKPLLGYGIEVYDPRKDIWQKCGACDVTVTSYKVTHLSENITYRFRVVGMNEVGNSAPLAGKKVKTKLHEIPLAQRSGSRLCSRMDTSRLSGSSTRSHRTSRSLPSTSGSIRHIGLNLKEGAGGDSLNDDVDVDAGSLKHRKSLMDTRESGVQTERGLLGPSVSNTETTFESETGSTLTDVADVTSVRPFNMAFSMYNRGHLQHLQRSINDNRQFHEQIQ